MLLLNFNANLPIRYPLTTRRKALHSKKLMLFEMEKIEETPSRQLVKIDRLEKVHSFK
jgi:hypothetical protein